MTPELRQLFDNVTNLPSPPSVAAQVIDLAQQPEIQLADVASAIQCDASLAAKVLRVANSAMYARRRKSTNLRQALVVLGLQATVTLALGFSLMPLLQRSRSENKIFEHTWRRTLMAGLCSRALADKTGRANAEEAFLASLLQDVGIMGIDRIKPGFYEDASDLFTDHRALAEFESVRLGVDHAQAGAHLLHVWKLPEYLQDAVAASHRLYNSTQPPESSNLSRVVGLSGPLADAWLAEEDRDKEIETLAGLVKSELGIDREDFAVLLNTIGESLPEMAQIFETDLINSNQAQMIVERAQEILTARSLQSHRAAESAVEKADELKSYANDLEKEAQRDGLTQVASRRHVEELLERGFEQAKRFSWPLAVMFLDLDHFKKVNDTYGHAAGDEVLRNVGQVMNDMLRDSDCVGRFGGEEFLIILPGADEHGLAVVADRMLDRIRKTPHSVGDARILRVTASIGCALMGPNDRYDTACQLVERADEALYAAKRGGRDRYIVLPAPSSGTRATAQTTSHVATSGQRIDA